MGHNVKVKAPLIVTSQRNCVSFRIWLIPGGSGAQAAVPPSGNHWVIWPLKSNPKYWEPGTLDSLECDLAGDWPYDTVPLGRWAGINSARGQRASINWNHMSRTTFCLNTFCSTSVNETTRLGCCSPFEDLLAAKWKAEIQLLINSESIKSQAGLGLSPIIPPPPLFCLSLIWN